MRKLISVVAALTVATVSSVPVLADTAPVPAKKPETAQQLRAQIAQESQEITQVQRNLHIQKVAGYVSYVTVPIWIYLALEGLAAKSFANGLDATMPAAAMSKAASQSKRLLIASGTGTAAFVVFKIYNSHQVDVLENGLIQLQQEKMAQLTALDSLK